MPKDKLTCATCKLRFDSMNNVRVHEWHANHGSPSTKCQSCVTGFNTEEELKNHVKIHYLYCCNFCSVNTKSWSYYKKHVRKHGYIEPGKKGGQSWLNFLNSDQDIYPCAEFSNPGSSSDNASTGKQRQNHNSFNQQPQGNRTHHCADNDTSGQQNLMSTLYKDPVTRVDASQSLRQSALEEVVDLDTLPCPEFSNSGSSCDNTSTGKQRPKVVPWFDKLDISLDTASSQELMEGKPTGSFIKSIVRTITDRIWEGSRTASRQEIGIVVSRFVNQYETLLEKDPQGRLLGCGYGGFLNIVEDRYRYLKRQNLVTRVDANQSLHNCVRKKAVKRGLEEVVDMDTYPCPEFSNAGFSSDNASTGKQRPNQNSFNQQPQGNTTHHCGDNDTSGQQNLMSTLYKGPVTRVDASQSLAHCQSTLEEVVDLDTYPWPEFSNSESSCDNASTGEQRINVLPWFEKLDISLDSASFRKLMEGKPDGRFKKSIVHEITDRIWKESRSASHQEIGLLVSRFAYQYETLQETDPQGRLLGSGYGELWKMVQDRYYYLKRQSRVTRVDASQSLHDSQSASKSVTNTASPTVTKKAVKRPLEEVVDVDTYPWPEFSNAGFSSDNASTGKRRPNQNSFNQQPQGNMTHHCGDNDTSGQQNLMSTLYKDPVTRVDASQSLRQSALEEVVDLDTLPCPEFSNSGSSCDNASTDEQRTNVLPWFDKLEISLSTASSRKLKEGKPSSSFKQSIVHEIVDWIWKGTRSASRQEIGIVVSRFANKYETLLEKDPQGRLLGCGFGELWNIVEDRYNYLNKQILVTRVDANQSLHDSQLASRSVTNTASPTVTKKGVKRPLEEVVDLDTYSWPEFSNSGSSCDNASTDKQRPACGQPDSYTSNGTLNTYSSSKTSTPSLTGGQSWLNFLNSDQDTYPCPEFSNAGFPCDNVSTGKQRPNQNSFNQQPQGNRTHHCGDNDTSGQQNLMSTLYKGPVTRVDACQSLRQSALEGVVDIDTYPCPEISNSGSSCENASTGEQRTIVLPWFDKLDISLDSASSRKLMEGKPDGRFKKSIIHEITDRIWKGSRTASRQEIGIILSRFVNQYKTLLETDPQGRLLGSGYGELWKMVQDRYNYLKRYRVTRVDASQSLHDSQPTSRSVANTASPTVTKKAVKRPLEEVVDQGTYRCPEFSNSESSSDNASTGKQRPNVLPWFDKVEISLVSSTSRKLMSGKLTGIFKKSIVHEIADRIREESRTASPQEIGILVSRFAYKYETLQERDPQGRLVGCGYGELRKMVEERYRYLKRQSRVTRVDANQSLHDSQPASKSVTNTASPTVTKKAVKRPLEEVVDMDTYPWPEFSNAGFSSDNASTGKRRPNQNSFNQQPQGNMAHHCGDNDTSGQQNLVSTVTRVDVSQSLAHCQSTLEEVVDIDTYPCPEISNAGSSCDNASTDKQRPNGLPWFDKLEISLAGIYSRKLMSGKPSGSLKKTIVQEISDGIWEESKIASREEIGTVVSRFVNQYETLLEKDPQGRLVGCGYAELWKMVEDRYRYLKRRSKGPDAPVSRSRGIMPLVPDTRIKNASNKQKYGCILEMYLPSYPDGQSEQSLERKRAHLKQLVVNQGSPAEISRLFNETFALVRRDIVKMTDMASLRDRWPYIFTVDGAMAHSVIYNRQNFLVTCMMKYEENASDFLAFFRSKDNTSERAKEALAKMEEAIAAVGNNSPIYAGLVLIFAGYFEEDMGSVLIEEKNRSIEVLESDVLPETPAIIYCGKDPMTSDKFMVSVRNTIVNRNISTFLAAFSMCFSYYFMFNLRYTHETTVVMDLFQRTLLALAPATGNNSRRKKDKYHDLREVLKFNSVYGKWLAEWKQE